MLTKTTILEACGAFCMGGANTQEIYPQAGAQRVGASAAIVIGPSFGLRVDLNSINISDDLTVGGHLYADENHLRQGGIHPDYFPLSNIDFRGGVRFIDDRLTGGSNPTNSAYSFGGKHYPAVPCETTTATARYPSVMPYFGIGFVHQPIRKGFSFITDLDVAYGVPLVSYTMSQTLTRHASDESADDRSILWSKNETLMTSISAV
jgi:hypothetical protein